MCNKVRSLGVWCALCAAGLSCAHVVAMTPSKTKSAAAQRRVVISPWQKATEAREKLEAIPAANRTRVDYAQALDAYRTIYHDDPQSKYAAAAVNAVAELLASQGRDLNDAKSLKAAIGQYEFLRMQYPGSSLRVGALLAQGQIYENDLHDAAAARERYQMLVKQYPSSSHAEEAKAGLASLDRGSSSAKTTRSVAKPQREESAQAMTKASASDAVPSSGSSAKHSSGFAPMATTGAAASETDSPVARRGTAAPATAAVDASDDAAEVPSPASSQATVSHVATASRRGGLAQVTGIRHWSTPNYTRVAIDLGDDVTYEAARVPNPDRIYFDLHGTRLAQSLVGKNFTVTDDGFLKKIRAAQFSNDMTRVVLDVNDVTEYSAFLLPNPYRLIIDIHGNSNPPTQVAANHDAASGAPSAAVPAPRTAAEQKTTSKRPVPNSIATANASSATDVAEVSAQPGRQDATSVPTSKPIAAVVPGSRSRGTSDEDVTASAGVTMPSSRRSKRSKAADSDPATPARAAVPTADGQTSLVRALGLKIGRIVIDAGHGGHDSGTLGVDGIQEKDVVLDVALRLGKLLHDRLGAEIIYTRSDDTFIPLETRTAIANKAQADLFLSIHANSSSDASARGVETYYLNFTSQPDALEVAARENAVSDQSIHQLSDLVKKIALKEKIDESREFASDVESSLYAGLQRGNSGLKNRGVKKAPFVVLIGANMPSILAEISFVTNPKDAEQLRQPEYRQRVAESLYKGVAKYQGGLGGARGSVEQASSR
ncbi:N-acetylmuramoyl-L-alanine amidase [Edaphobacter flagellatus]|uniref:N-acetylmuramoyl-L-alanine amidase n=1 Tax=Edaphobacter flagellatus TaxID=1933044 RepID=UPI0021B1FB7D|nr:N-acetylmuramoyl-L-alanine amidase [Edaphobacter flagellatus]